MNSDRLPQRGAMTQEARGVTNHRPRTRTPPGRGLRSLQVVLTVYVIDCVPLRSPVPLPKPLSAAPFHYILAKEHQICDFIKPHPAQVSRKIFGAALVGYQR